MKVIDGRVDDPKHVTVLDKIESSCTVSFGDTDLMPGKKRIFSWVMELLIIRSGDVSATIIKISRGFESRQVSKKNIMVDV